MIGILGRRASKQRDLPMSSGGRPNMGADWPLDGIDSNVEIHSIVESSGSHLRCLCFLCWRTPPPPSSVPILGKNGTWVRALKVA